LGSPVLCDKEYGRQETFTEREAEAAVHIFRTGMPEQPKCGQAGKAQAGKTLLVRQALHAAEIAFAHPVTGEKLRFSAPFPADMAAVLAPLRRARAEME
jgi:23S rRNA-/tRNA-specific pseudouridylate synthase